MALALHRAHGVLLHVVEGHGRLVTPPTGRVKAFKGPSPSWGAWHMMNVPGRVIGRRRRVVHRRRVRRMVRRMVHRMVGGMVAVVT